MDRELKRLYALHDHFEDALRAHEAGNLRRVKSSIWKAHDILDRIVIAEQAKRGQV